ncbi:alpha/beta fold hydrolase [Planctomycetales bacterium ZRK34]|nr:alpha/beta fold hydrolase [Planctomycetales bacterium ZRK34]
MIYRAALLLIALPLIGWWTWPETWIVRLIMLAPVVRFATLISTDSRERKLAVFLSRAKVFVVTIGISIAAAVAQHMSMAQMLGGFVRPTEVVFTAWFYIGCLSILEGIDWLLRRALMKLPAAPLRTPLRLLIIIMIILPSAMAIVECVRVKTGYTLGEHALAFDPIEFHTTTSDGLNIHGYFFDRGHDTTLIIAHGLGAHTDNFSPYATALLNDHPINSLIIDLRAHGYSAGHTASFGSLESRDLLAAVDWLDVNHPAASKHLVFYGFSMGAAAATQAAVKSPRAVGLILDSGYARLTDMAYVLASQLPQGVRQYAYYTGLGAASAITQAPLWKLAPVETIARLNMPVRVFHGSADVQIPREQGEQLLDLPNVTGRMIAGGGHTNLSADPRYFVDMGRFIDLLLADDGEQNPSSPDQPTIQAR